MTRDILTEIHSGSLSLEKAEDIYDKIMDGPEANRAPELLGLTPYEWTAFCHGVSFDVLAKWRSESWPRRCLLCGKEIAIEKYGWLARQHESGAGLFHVGCLEKK